MIPTLRNLQRLSIAAARHAVHQPVFMVDPARPPARQVAAEGFGFAGALERIASTFLDQRVQLVHDLGVVILPVTIVLPSRRPEGYVHGNDIASASPASKPRTASSKRSAFLGERNR